MAGELALGELLEGAGIAAEGPVGGALAVAGGVLGSLTGGFLGMALLFGAGVLIGRRMRPAPKPAAGTQQPA